MASPSWYVVLWRISTFATVLVAGYLIAHVIVLGRYFDWLVANGYAEMLRNTYSVFRVQVDPVTPYLGSFAVQAILGLCLLIATLIVRRRPNSPPLRLGAAIAASLLLPATLALFGVTGFHEVEDKVMSGSDLSPTVLSNWLRWNIPSHVACAVMYGAVGAWLMAAMPRRSVDGEMRSELGPDSVRFGA